MDKPLVSVKMITYNHAPFIARAIKGVLQQKTNFPFELVIGEDCSTDGTREIVFDYQKRYPHIVRVITSNENVGMIRNGYRTEKACTGKYIAWCEGDDYWHDPEKIQKQADYMENHPECGLVHSDYDRYYASTGEIVHDFNKLVRMKPPDDLDICSILRGGKYLYILTCTVLARRVMLREIIEADPHLYQSNSYMIGDTPRWAEIAWRSRTHYIDESLSTYTVLDNSASKSTDPIKQIKFGKSIHELFLYLVEKYKLPESEYNYHTKKWCEYSLQLAFELKDKVLAEEIKEKKTDWSLKERLWYLGTISNIINYSLKSLIRWKRKYLAVNDQAVMP
jgi:glycosyltransferase involved in cell wall biosynthesis